MTTGYVALYTIGGDGLGIASAATDVSLANRNLALGTGSVTGFSGTFGSAGTGLALVVGGGGTVYTKANIGGNLSTSTTNAYGLVIQPTMTWDGAATPVATGLVVAPIYSGTFTTVYGAYLNASSGGTISTAYSLYADNPSSGTTKVCGYFGGNVGIGKTVPTELLHLESSLRNAVIGIQTTSETNISRLFKAVAGSRADWTVNLDSDGVNWQRDDVSATGVGIALRSDGLIGFRGTAAGANPAILTEAFLFDAINGRMAIGGVSPSTNWRLYVDGRVHVGDSFDSTAYGQVQITRPAAQGTGFHQTFIRNGNAVFGMGFLSSSNTFGMHHGLDNTGAVGVFVDSAGLVGVGVRAPAAKFHAAYDTANESVATLSNTALTKRIHFRMVLGAGAYNSIVQDGDVAMMWDNNTAGDPSNGLIIAPWSSGANGIRVTNTFTLFGGGIRLPTSGGTVTTLDHYEELTYSMTFTGIWAANQTVNARIVRNGKLVTIAFPNVLATSNAANTISTTAPSALATRFRPSSQLGFWVRTFSNFVVGDGYLILFTDGTMSIAATSAGGNFAAAGSSGFVNAAISYNVM